MKLYVRSMSKTRSDLRGDLEQNMKPCMTHLAKLWLFPSAIETDHWRKEIASYYEIIQRVKPRNKVPSAKFILESTWGIDKHLKDKMVQRAIDHEDQYTPYTERLDNLDELYLKMEQYFIWIAEMLSKYEYISRKEATSKLIELGL